MKEEKERQVREQEQKKFIMEEKIQEWLKMKKEQVASCHLQQVNTHKAPLEIDCNLLEFCLIKQ